MLDKIAKNTFDIFIEEFCKEDNKKRLKTKVIDPIFIYVINRVYPYIIVTSIIFILMFLMVILILFYIIRK